MKTYLLALGLALSACGSSGLSGGNSDGGTTPDAAVSCNAHKDRASCNADSACEATSCCPDDPIVGCYPKGQGPIIECFMGCPTSASCADHKSMTDCDADTACASVTWENPAADCSGVNGGCAEFVECVDRGVMCTLNAPQGDCKKLVACGTGQAFYNEQGCSVGCIDQTLCSYPVD